MRRLSDLMERAGAADLDTHGKQVRVGDTVREAGDEDPDPETAMVSRRLPDGRFEIRGDALRGKYAADDLVVLRRSA
jgi:hypothetical protein